jgi:hypothetical protein
LKKFSDSYHDAGYGIQNAMKTAKFTDNTLLITGGTGTFGNAMFQRFLSAREVPWQDFLWDSFLIQNNCDIS